MLLERPVVHLLLHPQHLLPHILALFIVARLVLLEEFKLLVEKFLAQLGRVLDAADHRGHEALDFGRRGLRVHMEQSLLQTVKVGL